MKYLTAEKIAQMDDAFSFVPHHTRETLINYIENRLPTGSFVNAVLTNDLTGAFGQADHINTKHIGSIVAWLYNFAPSNCWGSPEKVKAWYAPLEKEAAA